MPQAVENQTDTEGKIEQELRARFTEKNTKGIRPYILPVKCKT